MIGRLPSGIDRLDGILAGGLVADSINLVIGVPGSGKTILAQRYAFTNATVARPALYISTVSEPLDKIVRFGQTLSFFDVGAIGSQVFYEDIGEDLGRGGLPAVTERIQALVRERRPGIIVIDSFKALTPYAADTRNESSYGLDPERVSTGIPLLDEMLGDGYWSGSATLCAGPSGIGKTLMGLHFITSGADQGEPGVIASLQENPSQLQRVAGSFSWTLDGDIEVMYRSPVDIQIDEWVYELLDTVERIGARRVLIDSLADLQFASGDRTRFREYMYSLTQRFSRAGVSAFMTSEVADLFTVTRLSDQGVSHLSDNVLLLQYLQDNADIRRAITVLKTRATNNHPQVHEFTITPNGITLGEAINTRPSNAV